MRYNYKHAWKSDGFTLLLSVHNVLDDCLASDVVSGRISPEVFDADTALCIHRLFNRIFCRVGLPHLH